MVAVTVLLEVPVLLSTLPRIQARLLVYAIPQALTLAIPFGVALGIFVGWGGSPVSFRLARVVLAIAIACSLVSGVMIGWVAPLSERAFSAAGRASVPLDELTEHELTLNELRQRSDLYRMRSNLSNDARRLATYYHFRWAFSFATFLLGLLAVSLVTRFRFRRSILGVLAACGASLGWFALSFAGTQAGNGGILPPLVAAWLPNLAVVAAFAVIRLGPADPFS